VPAELLVPENTWDDADKFRDVKTKLVRLFNENFKQFEKQVDAAITNAGPR
jgi:phosphoenolpyruvate carboxykinase (ATP)